MSGPYSIGQGHWPGVSKLIEETGELQQVLGKLIATNGEPEHWDGTDLRNRLIEEMGDTLAAVDFVGTHALTPNEKHRVENRRIVKRHQFDRWHLEGIA